MSDIIDASLERRGQLLNRRGFALKVQFGREDEDNEPDTSLLTRGINAHLTHWQPWWAALEGFLRYVHQDLASELDSFQCFSQPCSIMANCAGAKGTVYPRYYKFAVRCSLGLEFDSD